MSLRNAYAINASVRTSQFSPSERTPVVAAVDKEKGSVGYGIYILSYVRVHESRFFLVSLCHATNASHQSARPWLPR